MTDYDILAHPEIQSEGEDVRRLPINISAYRLLLIYLLLCRSTEFSLEQLNQHLVHHPMVQRLYSPETVNKYLQTLRRFGCEIQRFESNKMLSFRMLNHPLKLKLSQIETRSLGNLVNQLSSFPLNSLGYALKTLIQNLCQANFSDQPDLHLFNSLQAEAASNTLAVSKLKQFQRFCYEGQTLEILVTEPNGKNVRKLVEPQEVISHKQQIYLMAKDCSDNKKRRFLLQKIQSYRQLPTRTHSQVVKTTVLFKLTGRLASNYRPYPGETTTDKGEFLLVSHPAEEMEPVLSRLLKYGEFCQVISPLSLKQELLERIRAMYEALNEPVEDISGWF